MKHKQKEQKKEPHKNHPHPQTQGPTKTFQQEGKWIEKPNKTAILLCPCGNRYLKTRHGQEKCLRCLAALTL